MWGRAGSSRTDWREQTGDQWTGIAEAFYERLLARPDEALSRGGLPRDEVIAGLEEVSRKP